MKCFSGMLQVAYGGIVYSTWVSRVIYSNIPHGAGG